MRTPDNWVQCLVGDPDKNFRFLLSMAGFIRTNLENFGLSPGQKSGHPREIFSKGWSPSGHICTHSGPVFLQRRVTKMTLHMGMRRLTHNEPSMSMLRSLQEENFLTFSASFRLHFAWEKISMASVKSGQN
ncbi:hypothetical protein BD410DRAFT_211553 [Rickenella mellea]|uniref:Uncharacterized protein n=1 Tax=Rickenella mellea TaxID=50990 RepID=A0A4Y7Q681_9AGAM|nr:hypothetical protein BD410DRAFT_211553 [Rickenella mellea]